MSMGSKNSTISKGSHNSVYDRNNSNLMQTTISGQNANGNLASTQNTDVKK